MAFTVYTGKGMTFSWDAHSLTGLQSVSIEDAGKPNVEQLDKTIATSSAYEYMSDPLGAKGDDKATVVVKCLDSTVGITDTQGCHFTLGAAAAVAFASGGAGTDKYEHTALYLQKRVTTVPHDGLAEIELTFESNDLGTWGTT